MSCAILDTCWEYQEYETAYHLLTLTAGFVTLIEQYQDDTNCDAAPDVHVVTMTSRIGVHPIFANLAVWNAVMELHLGARRSERKAGSRIVDSDSDEELDDENDEIVYESAVATLYEMMGYSQDAMDLSRFAMHVSQERGWFSDDRGRQLLLLARRITARRDQADATPTSSDLGLGNVMGARSLPMERIIQDP